MWEASLWRQEEQVFHLTSWYPCGSHVWCGWDKKLELGWLTPMVTMSHYPSGFQFWALKAGPNHDGCCRFGLSRAGDKTNWHVDHVALAHEDHDTVCSILFLHVFTRMIGWLVPVRGHFQRPEFLAFYDPNIGRMAWSCSIIDVKICDSKSSQVCWQAWLPPRRTGKIRWAHRESLGLCRASQLAVRRATWMSSSMPCPCWLSRRFKRSIHVYSCTFTQPLHEVQGLLY